MKNYFINIQSFMIQDLHLKGCDLLIYAILWSYYQYGEKSYEKSVFFNNKQFQMLTGYSERAVRDSLNRLKNNGFFEFFDDHPGDSFGDYFIKLSAKTAEKNGKNCRQKIKKNIKEYNEMELKRLREVLAYNVYDD